MKVALTSRSRTTDLSLRALADVASVTREIDLDHRVVGGQMVAIPTHLAGVFDRVPLRETADTDAGVPKTATAAEDLTRFAAALSRLGYRQTAGDRFTRDDGGAVVIDVVLPALRTRRRGNVNVGPITAVEAGGLAYALGQPALHVPVLATLLDGARLGAFEVRLPTLQAALALKAFAWADRRETRDAIDVHRLLVAADVMGIAPASWARSVSLRGVRRDPSKGVRSCRQPGLRGGNPRPS